ncbi:MAG: hypothetical protein RLZZ306_2148 [Bacteroidota bacterium]|jgi:hypothetical protein
METKDKYILDVIEDGIQEAFRFRRFRIEEAKKEAEKVKPTQMVKRRSRQVAQNRKRSLI